MSKPSFIFLFTALLFLFSCSNSPEQEVFVFDPLKDYPEFPVSLSDIAEVSYIKLGGEEEGIYFSSLKSTGLFIDDLHSRLFACTPDTGVMEFDFQGRFIQRIGRLGRGPGEYMSVFFYVQPEEERVGVYDAAKEIFLVYNYDGSFLENEGIKARLLPGYLTFQILDGCLIDYNPYSVSFLESGGISRITSERTLNLFPIDGRTDHTIKDIHYERPLVIPRNWGENYQRLMMPGLLYPSYSGLMVSTYRSDTTYVIENDFSLKPFLVNERHNGVQEGCLYPSAETHDYLFLCHQNNLREGKDKLYYFAIDKRTNKAYKITEDETNPLPSPLQGKVQIENRGLTKKPEYRFWEFQPDELKGDCYEYLPAELKSIVDWKSRARVTPCAAGV